MVSEDRKMMLDPANWPQWPALPVKRNNEVGVMLSYKSFTTTVFKVNFWEVPNSGHLLSLKQLQEMPQIKYDSVDAILADGWIID